MQPGPKVATSSAGEGTRRATRRVAWGVVLGCPVQLAGVLAAAGLACHLAGLGPEELKSVAQRHWGPGLRVQATVSPSAQPPADAALPPSFTTADTAMYVHVSYTGAPRGARLDFRTLVNGRDAPQFGGSVALPDQACGTALWPMTDRGGLAPGFWQMEISSDGRLLASVQTQVKPAAGASQPRLVEVFIATAYDEASRQVFEAAQLFPRTTTELYVRFEWADAPRDSVLQMAVQHDGRELRDLGAEVKLGESRCGAGRARLHMEQGFPPGQYEASFLLDGRPLGQARFRVE